MKKNFLKQLACVLSLAMVVTSVAPATTAVEAAKASSLNAKAATISVGGKFDINVKNQVKGTKYTYDYMYAAGKNYVTLNKKTGVVTGKKAGKATIQCTAKKGKVTKILKCVITVAPKATKVTINNAEGNSTIKVGDKFQFKATVTPSNAAKSTWSISDSSVFKVDKNNGYVRALKPGKATLTVTNGTVSDKVELIAAADYSAVQAGTKTIKVTSPVILKESDIKVTKGSSTVTLADKNAIKFSDDKLSAEITTSGRLVDGTYKVVLNPEKTVEFTAAVEKVSKIQLLSDKAALTASTSSQATVGYKITNQFDEDITSRTSVQVSGSHSATGDGKGTITFDKGAIFNQNVDVVSVVIIHTESGLTEQATLTVSAAKAISEVTVLETAYNEDGKKLNGDSDLTKDDYYLLFEAVDQYGGKMNEIKLKGDSKGSAEAFLSLAPGMTSLKIADGEGENTKTKKITVNGKEYNGVKLASTNTKEKGKISSGTVELNVMGTLGKSGKGTITVEDGTEAVTLNIVPSDVVLAGNVNDFTFEAVDAYGNAVTKYSALKKVQFNGLNSVDVAKLSDNDKVGKMYFEEDFATGNAKLKYKAQGATVDTPVVVQYMLTNNKSQPVSFTIKAAALPKVITKVDKDLNVVSSNLGQKFIPVKAENIKMENQYGNEISFDNLKSSGYKIEISTTSSDNDDYLMVSSAGGKEVQPNVPQTFEFTSTIAKDTTAFTVTTNRKATTTEVARTFNLRLIGKDGKVISGSDYELNIKILPQGKLSSYVVEDIKPIYVTSKASGEYAVADDAFGRTVKVTGKRGDTTVVLDATQFSVVGTDDIKVVQTKPDDNGVSEQKIYSSKNTEFKDGVTEIKQKIIVTIGANGESFEKDVILKNEAPKVTSAKKDGDDAVNMTVVDAATLFAAGNKYGFKVKTQYDNDEAKVEGGQVFYKLNSTNKVDLTPRITFTDLSDDTIVVSNNGRKDASATLTTGKSAMVTLDFGNGQIVKFKVSGNATLN